ncbi:hypothetical protein [Membranihabitans marinus]|uniref:hypothetical protein n=1 Tax=Membranihabitans marinus TaxID=1227546 RepID=UPI001F2F7306|nr:hypothetical protein [Membranihabitans marinus]
MKLDFTLKLISFIYNETKSEENAQIMGEIQRDSEVNDSYVELMEANQLITIEKRRPSARSRARILDYSASTRVKTIL